MPTHGFPYFPERSRAVLLGLGGGLLSLLGLGRQHGEARFSAPVLAVFLLLTVIGSAWAATTEYRSIGTNAATLYSTGTITATNGSAVVTFSGSTLPTTVGQGDKLTINAVVYYVLSRDSAIQVTLQSNASATYSGASWTFTRVYNTLAAWNTGETGNLVTADKVKVGVCYNDGVFTAGVTISGWTTDATRYPKLTVATVARHTGTAGTGARIDANNTNINLVNVQANYAVVEWLALTNWRVGTTANLGNGVLVIGYTGVVLQNLMLHKSTVNPTEGNSETNGNAIVIGSLNAGTVTIRNCLIYDLSGWGISVGSCSNSSTITIQNCTVHVTGTGIATRDLNLTSTVQNCMVTGTGTRFSIVGQSSCMNNLSSDASAPGTSALTNKTAANQYVSLTGGSENLHLKAGADAINAGTDLSVSFTTDFEGQTRSGTWDMGADEVVISPIAYEPFSSNDYAAGNTINGINGGTGWGGAWALSAPSQFNATRVIATSPGMTWSGLPTTGIKAAWYGGSDPAHTGTRNLPSTYGGSTQTLWVSFLANFGNNGGSPDSFNLLNSGGTTVVQVRNYDNFGNRIQLLVNGGNAVQAGTADPSSDRLYVLRIDFTAGTNTVYLWVDPSLATEPSTGSANATIAGQSFTCSKLALVWAPFGGANYFDEIRLATSLTAVVGSSSSRYWVGGSPLAGGVGISPSALFGLRKMRAAYAGSAILVRRSSDNTEQGIGFTATGDLDVTALTSFVGSGSGYVKTWYDQSGNGQNATQATAGAQPVIVASGTVLSMNGRPTVSFNGAATLVAPSFPALFNNTTGGSENAVAQAVNTMTDWGTVVSAANGSTWWGLYTNLPGGGFTALSSVSGSIDIHSGVTWTSPLVVTHVQNPGVNQELFVDGVSKGTAATGNFANTGACYIGADNGIFLFIGTISEITLWPSALSTANRQALEYNQGAYFSGSALAWSDTRNWSANSGGAGGATVPTVIDNVYFNANGLGGVTVDVAATAASVTMASGYIGTMALGTNTLTVAGSADLRSGGSFTGTTGGLTLSATGTLTPPASGTIPTLTISGGTTTLATNAVSVAGNLTINASTTLATGGRNLSVAGNWANSGTFTHGSATVTLNGAGASTQVISGTTTFNNLTATCSTARTLNFTACTTQTVSGTLTLTGASGQRLSLRSTSTPSTWSITPNGTRTCSFVDVKDSINTASPVIAPTTSTNSGNNTLWFPPSPTKLAVTTINGGSSPTVGVAFSVVVQAQDGSSVAAAVVANTAVTLSKATGTGVLGGTLTGTILAGQTSVTISGVTYDYAESGVSVTATRTSGDTLTAGTSATFTVIDNNQRYWRATAAGNWTSTANWAYVFNGTTGAPVPSAVDAVFFDGGSLLAATGGTVTTSAGYTYHTFTGDGTFTPSIAGTVEVLVVAGGGGGGNASDRTGGGGGGGGPTPFPLAKSSDFLLINNT